MTPGLLVALAMTFTGAAPDDDGAGGYLQPNVSYHGLRLLGFTPEETQALQANFAARVGAARSLRLGNAASAVAEERQADPVVVESKPEEKKAVDALEKSLRAKALRPADVPAVADGLAKARAQLAQGDLDGAKVTYAPLQQEIANAKVDAKLVAAKPQRLNAALKAKNLPKDQSAPLYWHFEQAQGAYFKGDYASANKSLNEIEDAL